MGDVSNIVVGSQSENTVKIGDYGVAEASARDVGFIKGGVTIEHDETRKAITVDQMLGPVDNYASEENMTVKFSISEASLANIAEAYGYSYTSGTFSFGDRASETAKTLYINTKGPAGGTRKYTFWKVKPTGKTSQAYKKDEETMVDVEFTVLVDATKTVNARFGTVVDTGADSTAPTIAMTTPASGGVRTVDTQGTVLLTITEANEMDENSIVYGDTVQVIKEGGGTGASTLVAGAIAYDSSAKTITFTPSSTWTAGNYSVLVTTGLRDAALNNLATAFSGYFTVSA